MITNKEKLKEFISSLDSPNKVYDLFRELNYPKDKILDVSKRDIKEFDFAKDEREKVQNIYTVFSYDKDLSIFFIEVKGISISNQFIRYITRVFDDRYNRFLLILTIDFNDIIFVFPDREKIEVGKHKLKITKLALKRDELYYTDVETISNIALSGNENSYREIWFKWKEAFNVEKVTKHFFEDYKGVFFTIRGSLNKQKIDWRSTHEYTIQLLNRIMFIYFISKKRWLRNDPKFMKWFWNRYNQEVAKGNSKKNTFYNNWLKPIFFEAFNNQFSEKKELPDDVNKVLLVAPYLNGGLFRKNSFDDLPIDIDDKLFEKIFSFFEKYNFTIKEDMPLDMEIAVDPQMIGYVYESLANVGEKAYESDDDLQGDWGIFYTPRVEVDFMARRALVEYLNKNLPIISKERIYELVFDEKGTDQFKQKVVGYFEKEKYWSDLEEALDNLSIVDPAVGSGAFLVGMLDVLVELYKIIYKYQKRNLTDFNIKRRVIMKSLYGVDVMRWAIHAAELRWWLQLIVDPDLTIKDIKRGPLLPNLDINLRVGNSLVQEIGGINLHIRDCSISSKMKKKLDTLKHEKEKYFNSDPTAKFNKKEELIGEEVRIFEEVIKEKIASLEEHIGKIKQKLKDVSKQTQTNLFGKKIKEPQDKLVQKEDEYKEELEKLELDLSRLKDVLPHISDPEKKDFVVWDIDFAEVFGDKGGFDIVIGNPPYVRQEKIAPPPIPNKLKEKITNEDKREYKEKLINAVKAHFSVIDSLDKKSDYYIYFYFGGLSILNPKGTFCFITSNSWLDVDYGKELQEFLLRYTPIHAIYDNSVKRSFEHADVNTIIALLGAPDIKEPAFGSLKSEGHTNTMLSSVARFVMFKRPFEEVISSKNLIDIERAKDIRKTSDYRVYPISHADLMEDGWEYPEGYDSAKEGRFRKGEYAGNKWGGKYLHAPDIFFTILEKGKGKLVRLVDIAEIRRGFTTGVNEFFYLDEEAQKKWQIEGEFLKTIIKSPKECKSILINPKDLKYKVFVCHKSKKELKSTNALKYIERGEKQKTEGGIFWCKVPTVSGRKLWYELPELPSADVLFRQFFNEIFNYPINPSNYLTDHTFYYIHLKNQDDIENFGFVLNSTVSCLFTELYGRKNMGEGVLTTYGPEMKPLMVLNPKYITTTNLKKFQKLSKREIKSIFEECGIDPSRLIREQEPKPLPDRKELDDIIFNAIGLTNDEIKEVYWAVCELVKNRLDKAGSLKKNA